MRELKGNTQRLPGARLKPADDEVAAVVTEGLWRGRPWRYCVVAAPVGEGPQSTQPGGLAPLPRGSASGHEEQVPRRRLRVCYESDYRRSRRVPSVRFQPLAHDDDEQRRLTPLT